MTMRSLLVIVHRWFGLAAAVFLFIAGATGAIISWDHELDAWLNPHLFHARSAEQLAPGKMMSGLELANRVEAQDKRLRVTYVMTENEPGHTSSMMVEGRINPATGQPFDLGFNQIAVDPASGEIQGKRMWGAISLNKENLLPFLYKLHYTMHLPEVGGIELGVWLMGLIGIVWALDSFIALWLSFPNWRSWRKSFAFRWRQGGHKLNFDLHRSSGVWLWILLLILAITSVSMNLERPVIRPIILSLSTLTPTAFDTRTPKTPAQATDARISREQAVALAAAEGHRRGWSLPVGGVFYSSAFGLYGAGFFEAGNDHGDVGLGNAWLYFDADTGQPTGAKIPGIGSAGDLFMQAQFPLHSGRILGVPGRIMISLLGLAIAMLSVTGIVIWARKRRARLLSVRQNAQVSVGKTRYGKPAMAK